MNMLVLTWCPGNHFPLLLTIYMVSLSLCHQQASAFLPLLCQWHTTRTTDSPGSPQHLPPGKTKGRLYSNFLQTAIKQRFSTLAPSLLIHNQCHILWQLIPLSSWEMNLWVCFDPHLFFSPETQLLSLNQTISNSIVNELWKKFNFNLFCSNVSSLTENRKLCCCWQIYRLNKDLLLS